MRVPSIVFPISTVLANGVQLLLGTLPVFILIAFGVGQNPLWAPLLAIPVFALLCLSLGVGLVLSSLFVFFRDIPYLYELAYFALFVATPVFYPLAIIESKYRPFIEYNPLTMVVEQIRAIAVFGDAPSASRLALLVFSGFAVLAVGTLIFRRASKTFMDYL
jgi:ABC-type polysaccharide/polyol phosphate export permease